MVIVKNGTGCGGARAAIAISSRPHKKVYTFIFFSYQQCLGETRLKSRCWYIRR